MSEEYELKGPEEEQVEHHAVHGNDNFASRIAVLTAILATVTAIFSYNSSHTESEAMIMKSESAIIQTKASDQWSYYQAKSTKQAVMEGALINATNDDAKKKISESIKRYDAEKEKIKEVAQGLEEKSHEKSIDSEKELKHHHRWALAMTVLQIAISLAAITILTKKRWMFWTSGGVASFGIILGLFAWFAA